MKFVGFPSFPTAAFAADKFFVWSTRICLGIQLLSFGLIIWSWNKLPPLVPLHYTLPWGEEQLVTPIGMLLFSFSATGFAVINSVTALLIYTRSTYLAHMLLAINVLVTTLIVFSIMQVILLVT